MTNIIPLDQATQAQLPSYLRQAELDSYLNSPIGVPRISLAGGIITVKQGSETLLTFGNEATVLIVGIMPHDGRVYYDGVYAPNSDEVQLPACWSNNNQTPDPDAVRPQSPTCANCPQNVKGSARNGQGRACAFMRNVAIAFPEDPQPGRLYRLVAKGMTMFGPSNVNMHEFNLKSLPAMLQARGLSLAATVLRMKVDPSAGVPGKLVFTPIGVADDTYLANFYDLARSQQEGRLIYKPEVHEEVQRIIQVDFGKAYAALAQKEQDMQAAAPQAPQAPTAPVAPAPAQPVQPQPMQAAAPQAPQAPTAPVAPAPAQPQPQPVQAPPAQPQPQPQPQPVQQAQTEPTPGQASPASPAETSQPVQNAQPEQEAAPEEPAAQAVPWEEGQKPQAKPANLKDIAAQLEDDSMFSV